MAHSRESTSPRKNRRTTARVATPRLRGSVESGANTRELVLQVARDLLVHEGYANFSIRRVAEATGITVGNLTYHFPSKRELVRALIASLISQYRAAKEKLYAEVSVHPERRLEKLVEWVMRDAASATTNRLFRELWTMALHDPVAARAIDEFYEIGIDAVAAKVREAHPKLDVRRALELAHLVALVSEGSSVIYGTRPNRKVPIERLAQVVSDCIAQAIDAPAPTSGSGNRRPTPA